RAEDAEAGVVRPGPRESSRRPAVAQSLNPVRDDRARKSAVREGGPRTRTSHRLIFLLVPLLVIAAVRLRHWNATKQEFPLVAERGRTEGIPALDEGKFDKAYQLLSAAKTAVDALGGAVEDAEAIRHAAAEAALFVNRCPRSVEDLLAEAGRTDP